MICPHDFIKALAKNNITRFAGVPDSLLKELCHAFDSDCSPDRHVITANEGNAIGLAIGHHIATGEFAAVYMQNSGLGNAVNPLVSLAAPEIYEVGMLLLIGWRGEPGVKDEPQHALQGRITKQLLEVIGIPYHVIDPDRSADEQISSFFGRVSLKRGPAALLIRKGTFSKASRAPAAGIISGMLREDFLKHLLANTSESDLLVATTGKTSRELFELREARSEPHRDFLVVGGMGHASSIALGMAVARTERRVWCLDGDGAMLMHMGALPIIAGKCSPANLIYVLLNNGVHESVGGQQTAAGKIDMQKLAAACGFSKYLQISDRESCLRVLEQTKYDEGPMFIEAVLLPGSREDLGRPTISPIENKLELMRFLNV